MGITMEIDDKLLRETLALNKAKAKKRLLHCAFEALNHQQRIERLLGRLGCLPLRLTPRKLTQLRSDG